MNCHNGVENEIPEYRYQITIHIQYSHLAIKENMKNSSLSKVNDLVLVLNIMYF